MGEPEDNSFGRDWGWVPAELKNAYQKGIDDALVLQEGYVKIPVDAFEQLQEESKWLSALEAAGVDNWEGISYAHEIFGEEDD